MKSELNILVLGVGNILMSDDGAGVHIAEKLQKKTWPEGVQVLEAGASILNYMYEISSCNTLIAVDALRGGSEPGSIYCLRNEEIALSKLRGQNAHGFSLFEVTALTVEMTGYPERVIIYGVEPLSTNPGTQLSPAVQRAVPYIAGKIEKEIDKLIL